MKKFIGMLMRKLKRKKIIILLNTEEETVELSSPHEFAKKVSEIHGKSKMP